MEIYSKLLSAKICLIVVSLLICASCVTQTSSLRTDQQTSEKKVFQEKTGHDLSLQIPEEEISALSESETKENLLPQAVPLENGHILS